MRRLAPESCALRLGGLPMQGAYSDVGLPSGRGGEEWDLSSGGDPGFGWGGLPFNIKVPTSVEV